MKINFQADGVIITAKQKALMEKKIYRLKKYLNHKDATIDIILKDDSSVEKGGIDQSVHLSTILGREKIFIEEVDDRLMRAFALAFRRFERRISEFHQKRVESFQGDGENRFEKLWNIIKRKKHKK